MYMDDIKLFAKNEKELETLIHTVRIYSQDIGMEFGIEKCAMLVMKSGKRHMTDGMELPNHDKIWMLGEEETYKYLGILEADSIKQVEIKDKIRKEYLRRTRKLLATKVSSRNLIKRINTWVVPLVRYSGPFLKWTRDELKQMDQRTRKLMTMHKALHPRDDVDRLYVPRKEGGRGLTRIEDSVDESIQRLEDYIEKHERGIITAIRNDTDNMIDGWMTTTRKQKWEKKQFYGRFKRLINNISHQKTWTWLSKGNLKRETESLLIAAQDNAIKTNHVKARIDKTQHYHHYHHHVVPQARIPLTLSRHFFLSFIASGKSSGLHPVSSHSCCMYVRVGRPAFARSYVGVHRSTSLMSWSLLLQQCPAYLVRLSWIVFMMGGRWPYSWCLVGCCRQDLFNIARSILV